ncbi:MAG: hybrid sensor histidine kinase/response regulator [Chloroflexi bacterium]|nr:hybrid sensor histidine kinase/response regulator [Chloroflexota bacterium]
MTQILVIEDEEPIRENLRELLEAEGYEVLTAADGRVGAELAQQHLPDLILSDILMPEMDGYDVLTTLQQNRHTANIPFIFLTARTDRENMRAGMTLGADDYLTKPFTREDVLQAIRTRLAKRSALQAEQEAKIDDLRRHMATMLPHELRTPLTGIMGYATFLRENYEFLQPEQIREVAGNIQNYSQRLQQLVQRFLLYAELELQARDDLGAEAWRNESLENAADLIAHVAQAEAQKAKRETDLRLDLETADIRISEPHFYVLLEELIENAFKFSEPGQPVHVCSRVEENGAFVIAITGHGRGMTPEQVAAIGAYRQFDRDKYEQQGQGLGLAIAMRIAEIYGGSLVIKSEPNKETVARVTLLTTAP